MNFQFSFVFLLVKVFAYFCCGEDILHRLRDLWANTIALNQRHRVFPLSQITFSPIEQHPGRLSKRGGATCLKWKGFTT